MTRQGRFACAVLALASVAGCATHHAGSSAAAPPRPRLAIGDVVEVRQRGGTKVAGTIVRVEPTEFEVSDQSAEGHVMRWPSITRITTIHEGRADSVLNGTLIGSGIGAGYAGIVVVGVNSSSDSVSAGKTARGVALGAAIGAGVGAVIDALRRRPERRVVYRAP